jgi:hypothetical protein
MTITYRRLPPGAKDLENERVVRLIRCRYCWVAAGVRCNGRGLPLGGRDIPHAQRYSDAWDMLTELRK